MRCFGGQEVERQVLGPQWGGLGWVAVGNVTMGIAEF